MLALNASSQKQKIKLRELKGSYPRHWQERKGWRAKCRRGRGAPGTVLMGTATVQPLQEPGDKTQLCWRRANSTTRQIGHELHTQGRALARAHTQPGHGSPVHSSSDWTSRKSPERGQWMNWPWGARTMHTSVQGKGGSSANQSSTRQPRPTAQTMGSQETQVGVSCIMLKSMQPQPHTA